MNIKRIVALLTVYILFGCTVFVKAGNIDIYTGETEDGISRLAVEELDSYLSKMFVDRVKLKANARSADIIIGTVKDNEKIA